VIRSCSQFGISKATHQVIIHHADRLHEGVTDRWPDEVKSALEQVFAHLH
jgi:hypothetical protein